MLETNKTSFKQCTMYVIPKNELILFRSVPDLFYEPQFYQTFGMVLAVNASLKVYAFTFFFILRLPVWKFAPSSKWISYSIFWFGSFVTCCSCWVGLPHTGHRKWIHGRRYRPPASRACWHHNWHVRGLLRYRASQDPFAFTDPQACAYRRDEVLGLSLHSSRLHLARVHGRASPENAPKKWEPSLSTFCHSPRNIPFDDIDVATINAIQDWNLSYLMTRTTTMFRERAAYFDAFREGVFHVVGLF